MEASNPFSNGTPRTSTPPSSSSQITPSERQAYLLEFQRICPRGKLGGVDARPILEETQLPQETLAQIWRLADWDADGSLDSAQYVIAKHYVKIAQQGGTLPDQLPAHMAPSYTGASILG
jgi:hypothetical protein